MSQNQPLPPALILGGKKRFKEPLQDPSQCWEIKSSRSDSPHLEIRSRTANQPGEISLIPTYTEPSQERRGAVEKSSTPLLDQMAWDWISMVWHPLPDLEVEVIHWVPDPRVICGIHRIQNTSEQDREITLTLSCQDEMGLTGTRFRRDSYQGRKILTGSSPERSLVLSLSGSQPQASDPTNQLTASISLESTGKAELRWILIWSESKGENRSYLNEVINLDWEGEISRRIVSLSNQLMIRTGNPAWDQALACSQRLSRVLLERYFLQAQEDGAGKLPLTALQLWQLTQALTPLPTSDLEQLLVWAIPGEQPGFPIQAELLWQALEAKIDPGLALTLLTRVKTALASWFSAQNDKDRDGIPEYPGRDLFQLDQFQSDPKQSWDCIESPALAAFLQVELRQLIKSQARIPGDPISADFLEWKQILGEYILASWDEAEKRFRSRDYQSHTSREGCTLPISIKMGWNQVTSQQPLPARLALLVSGAEADQIPDLQVTFHGRDWQGRYRIEELTVQNLFWHGSGCWGATTSVYDQLDYIVVSGASDTLGLELMALESDPQDLSQILPLWTNDLAHKMGQGLIDFHLKEPTRFWSERGLKTRIAGNNSAVQLPLNILILQGLIRNDGSQIAARLYETWLDTMYTQLEKRGSLFGAWDAQTGDGIGKGDQLESLLPISLLLELLGCQFHAAGELVLEARTPLFCPVSLNFKGVEIILEESRTILNRPGRSPQIISREKTALIQL